MTPWFLAMAAIMPLMGLGARGRVWLVMICSSLSTLPFPSGTLLPALFNDLICGAVLLKLFRPHGCAQRAIGALFAFMALFDIGFLLSPQNDVRTYYAAMMAMSWGQFAILAVWGAHDVGKVVARRFGIGRHSLAPDGGAR